jgi:DNA-binding MarR family transcriptional regulator
MADGDLDLAHELAGLLFQVTEQTRQVFESTARRFELTAPQARALMELRRPAPMRLIADKLGCDASNVTGIADRLQARGLVTREPDPADRRVKTLVLTAKGQRARADLERAAHSSPAMSTLSPTERNTLRRLLTKMAAATA